MTLARIMRAQGSIPCWGTEFFPIVSLIQPTLKFWRNCIIFHFFAFRELDNPSIVLFEYKLLWFRLKVKLPSTHYSHQHLTFAKKTLIPALAWCLVFMYSHRIYFHLCHPSSIHTMRLNTFILTTVISDMIPFLILWVLAKDCIFLSCSESVWLPEQELLLWQG